MDYGMFIKKKMLHNVVQSLTKYAFFEVHVISDLVSCFYGRHTVLQEKVKKKCIDL